MCIGFDDEQAGHLRIFDDLHGIENTDQREISGECDIGANFNGFFIAVDGKVGTAGAANRFKSGGDRNARVEQFCFLQPVVSNVEIFARNIKIDERETLPRGFVQSF